MLFGLDYVTGPPIADMLAHDPPVAFVCRYLSAVNALTKQKLLSLDEAKTLSGAGLAIVSNYEWYADRALEGFASGVADAQIAAAQHTACGGPADRPIYFSVDFDATPAQLPTVGSYFKGVASVIDLSRTAAYGPYEVIKYLFDNHLISWGWQTYAWSGGQWEPRAHIQQYNNGVTLAGLSVDYNRSMQSDFGQWTIERTTWVNQYQQAQALATWQSNTNGAIAVGGNALAASGIFPAGGTPPYDTGIAKAWQRDYMNGQNHGAPTSYEYSHVNGVQLTDWSGNPIVQQNFAGGRYEWSIKTGVATWYPWK